MITIFDFDKTLTKKDTLFGFYKICVKYSFIKKVLLYFYVVFMIAQKYNIISNTALKKIGIKFFLEGQHAKTIRKFAKEYSMQIELNNVSIKEFKKYENPYIISASFSDYISILFPKTKIYGTELLYDKKNRVKGLKRNCYYNEKYNILKEDGIIKIDAFYTDSINDMPLAEISDTIYVVKQNRITECLDLEHYKRILGKFDIN